MTNRTKRYGFIVCGIGWFIWNSAELFHIRLGRLAPIIFGWMIGCKGIEVDRIGGEPK